MKNQSTLRLATILFAACMLLFSTSCTKESYELPEKESTKAERSSDDSNLATARNSGIRATALTGDQVQPAASTSASGEAYFIINNSNGTVDVVIQVKNMTSPTGARLNFGPAGNTGSLIVSLGNGNLFSTNSNSQPAQATFTLNELNDLLSVHSMSFRDAVRQHLIYIDITSTNYPNGELRGQF